MLLVDAVEAEMGPVKTWPPSTLTIIFAYDPTRPGAIYQLMRVIAFFTAITFL